MFLDNTGKNMLNRIRQFSQRRRASRKWRAACIKNEVIQVPKPQLILENTNFSEDLQHTAIEVTSQALEKCRIENEIASFIKMYFDSEMGPTWHCIVGRNFGSHIAYESYIHFTIAKVTILLFKCG
ncbi:Dynein light chain 1, cytoplasmic [Toxocara canis]|uniref:Dynein light chain n=1 Tax=Toxocara canis TaxID=6265 RepID=A0A0B2VAX8_TOXCA|nr:Dynein light chain 1, cytoplasmic [Toxocara canis]